MELDPQGRWIEYPIGGSDHDARANIDDPAPEELPLPPAIPAGWVELAETTKSRGMMSTIALILWYLCRWISGPLSIGRS